MITSANWAQRIGATCWLPIIFVLSLLLSAEIASAAPYIDLGAMQDAISEDMKWAYVNVEMSSVGGGPGPGPYGSTVGLTGASIPHNRPILDTGSNSAMFVAEAAAELEANGIVSLGGYKETGVAGTETYNVSGPYRYQFWGTTDTTRYTLSPDGGTQVMYSPAANIGGRLEDALYPVPGILGMPAMTGRVSTLDMRPWLTAKSLFDTGYMDTSFSQTRPSPTNHRYSVELRASPQFNPEPEAGGPVPVWANIPFATVRGQHGELSATGNFLIDTGANSSIFSPRFATELGLDSNHDEKFNSADDTWVADATIAGVGGTDLIIPVFGVEKLFLPTREGVELAWGSAESPPLVGILDVAGLDGVFGMDMLANTKWDWDTVNDTFVGDPNFRQLHFDFLDWEAGGLGTLWLDLSPELDVVVPEPATWLMLWIPIAALCGLIWRRRRQ